MKKTIDLYQLKDAVMTTFKHYSWDVTDYDVWVGIRDYFSETLWRNLDKRKDRRQKFHLRRKPEECLHKQQWDKKESEIEKQYKHLFWKIYIKTPPPTIREI